MKRGRAAETRERLVGLALAVALSLAYAAFYAAARPDLAGDEPHYVAYANSIAHGWGLDLRRAYEPENVRWFYRGTLAPHARPFSGRDGRLATWHGIALPLILAPFVIHEPPLWVLRLVMIAIAAALAYHLFRLVRVVTDASLEAAAIGVGAVSVAPPVVYFSGQIFPELAAALLVVLALRALSGPELSAQRLAAAAIAAGVLPGFNPRYATLTAGLIAAVCFRAMAQARGTDLRDRLASLARSTWPAVLLLGVAAAGLAAFNVELFGSLHPVLRWPVLQRLFGWERIGRYGLEMTLATPNGILPLAPILLVALSALGLTTRQVGATPTAGVAAIALFYVGVNLSFGSAGWSVPGRYLVSVVPLLAIPLALAVSNGGAIAHSAIAATLPLTLLSTLTSALHFQDLYTLERRGIEPMESTSVLWPEQFEPRPKRKLTIQPQAALHKIGELETTPAGTRLVAREGRDPAGALAVGPFVTLHPGRYRAEYELFSEPGASDATPVTLDVVHTHGGIIGWKDVSLPAGGARTVESISFETEGKKTIELRVFFHGRGVVGLGERSSTPVKLMPVGGPGTWKAIPWLLVLGAIAWRWSRDP